MEVEVVLGDLLQQDVDAIVNPANARGLMGGGVAAAIRRAGGETIQQEALAQAPIPLGEAIVTSAGRLPYEGVIHAPTMAEPGGVTDPEIVERATRAALRAAEEAGFRSIAFPGMGTGVGGLDYESAARAMVRALKAHSPQKLQRVLLVARDPLLAEAWKEALQEEEP